jgi:hypothetical protein
MRLRQHARIFGFGAVDSNRRLRSRITRYACTAAFALALVPIAAHADCLPAVPGGWYLPFTMSTHGINHVVSYAQGNMTTSFFMGTAYYTATNGRQLFNDRLMSCGQYCFPYQPFDYGQADSIGVQIAQNVLVSPPSTTVTLTLNSWGGGKFSFAGKCDSDTNLLYGSVNRDTMVVISFGTPSQPPR